MIPALLALLPGPRQVRLALLALAAVAGVALASLPGEAGPLAARAALAALAVGGGAALLRRRLASAPAPSLRVAARAGLGRTASVALVEVDGRRLLLGVADRSVELLCELSPERARQGGQP